MPDYRYIGEGACIPGFPARDLRAEEVEARGFDVAALDAATIYERVPEARETKRRGDVAASEKGGAA